jgi:hypothetical protein
MGGEGGGFDLSKLLGALGSNAGLSALGIGAQGVGSLLEGRAQSKADKAAGKQQRTNNAIAAFTGGNAAQATPERASSTVGGLLKALGQGAGGFAQARQAQEGIDQAQVNADRQFGLDERGLDQIDDRTAALTEVERIRAATKAAVAGVKGDKAKEGAIRSSKVIVNTFAKLKTMFQSGGDLSTGVLGSDLIAPELVSEMETMRDLLIGEMNNIAELGRLSKEDVVIIKGMLPNPTGEREAIFLGKMKGALEVLDARLKALSPSGEEGLKALTGVSPLELVGGETPQQSDGKGGGSGKAAAKNAAKAAFDRGDLDEAERIMDEAGV